MIGAGCAVLGRVYDRSRCAMTIPAPEPDPHARESASGGAAVGDGGGGVAAGRCELRLVVAPECGDPGAAADAGAVPSTGELGSVRAAGGPTRRLRAAPPVQLELVSGWQGPRPEVVWASLPERSREAVLVLLARLIDSGAVEEER